MPTSEARIQANRVNATRSTGPRTISGRNRSSQNSLKHGLTGAGVVVPDQDRDEIERRVEALNADLNPRSELGAALVRQMAVLSVRMERGARQESAALARRVRHAAADFDEARFDEAERLFDGLADDPRVHLRKLRKSPEGVDRLVVAWQELRADLARDPKPVWTAAHLETAAHLTGLRGDHARGSRIGALSRAVWGDFGGLAHHEGGHLDDARKAWAHTKLLERIDAEVAALEIHRDTLDFELIELDRAEAGARALFDPSREATLARRYESESHRAFFKALKEFRQAEAEFAERAESSPAPAPPPPPPAPPAASPLGSFREGPSGPLGSFREEALPAHPDLSWGLLDVLPEAPIVRGPDGQPLRIGRPAPMRG
jgi:hypothetical protein